MQTIKDWHLLLALGVILGIEAVAYIILQTIAFTVTIEFGEEVNKENPVTINVTNNFKPHLHACMHVYNRPKVSVLDRVFRPVHSLHRNDN